jgi:hypothetical protein
MESSLCEADAYKQTFATSTTMPLPLHHMDILAGPWVNHHEVLS